MALSEHSHAHIFPNFDGVQHKPTNRGKMPESKDDSTRVTWDLMDQELLGGYGENPHGLKEVGWQCTAVCTPIPTLACFNCNLYAPVSAELVPGPLRNPAS